MEELRVFFPEDIASIVEGYTVDYHSLYEKHISLQTYHWTIMNNWLNLLVEMTSAGGSNKLMITCALFERHITLLHSCKEITIGEYQLYGLMLLYSVYPGSIDSNPLRLSSTEFVSYITDNLYMDPTQMSTVLDEVNRSFRSCHHALFRILLEQGKYLPFSVLTSPESIQALRYANNLAIMHQWDYRDIGVYWCLSLSLATKIKVPLELYRSQPGSFHKVYPNFPLSSFHGVGKASVAKLGVGSITGLYNLLHSSKPRGFSTYTWECLKSQPV
jgi:hypothetical protein